MRQRRVDLERLRHLLLPAEVLDRAEVVEPVGKLDRDDADVLRHRHDHLAVVLRLSVLAALEVDRVSFVTPSTSCATSSPNSARSSSSSTSVSSTTSWSSAATIVCSSRRSSAQIFATPNGVVDEVLAGAALLARVSTLGEAERVRDELGVELGQVALDLGDQLLDEVLVFL